MAIGSLCNFLSFWSISLNNSVHCFFGRKKSMISTSKSLNLSSSEVLYWHVPKSMEYMQGGERDLWAVFEDPDHPKNKQTKKKRNGTSNDRSTSVLRIETVIVRFLFWETNPNQGGFASPKGWCFGNFSAVGFDWDFLGESPSVLLL